MLLISQIAFFAGMALITGGLLWLLFKAYDIMKRKEDQ